MDEEQLKQLYPDSYIVLADIIDGLTEVDQWD